MAHMAKFKGASSAHIIGHCERERGEEGYLKYNNNSYIDDELTHLNYSYRTGGRIRLQERLDQIAPSRRKDAVTMVDWVVTLPEALKDASEDQQKRFFDITDEFLANRYGQENVVGSYVHLDETSPHLHFCFVPVVEDKKTGMEKLCCKELMTKGELNKFHKELDKTMESEFGIKGLILTGITKEAGGNKSVAQLKAKTMADGVENLKNVLTPIQDEINAQIADFSRSNAYYFLTGLINERNSTRASDIFRDRGTYYFQDIKFKRNGILIPEQQVDSYLKVLPYLTAKDIIAEKTDEFMKAMETYSEFEPLEKYQEARRLQLQAEADRKQASKLREQYERLLKEQEDLNKNYRSVCTNLESLETENRQLRWQCNSLEKDNVRQQKDLEYYMDLISKANVRENYYASHYGSVSQETAEAFDREQQAEFRKLHLSEERPSIRRTRTAHKSRQKEDEFEL